LKSNFGFWILDFGLPVTAGLPNNPEPLPLSDQSKIQNPKSKIVWLEGRCLELAVTDRYSLFVDLLRHYFAWPAEADEAARVARIAAALLECTVCGTLSTARAEEMGPLLADLFSLRWGEPSDDADHQGVGSDRSIPSPAARVPAFTLHSTPSDPEQRRQQTLLAIRDFLLALARQQP